MDKDILIFWIFFTWMYLLDVYLDNLSRRAMNILMYWLLLLPSTRHLIRKPGVNSESKPLKSTNKFRDLSYHNILSSPCLLQEVLPRSDVLIDA